MNKITWATVCRAYARHTRVNRNPRTLSPSLPRLLATMGLYCVVTRECEQRNSKAEETQLQTAAKMSTRGYRLWDDFYRATLCVSALVAIDQWPSVCLSVRPQHSCIVCIQTAKYHGTFFSPDSAISVITQLLSRGVKYTEWK